MEEIKNYGVILGQRPEDYIAGATSPLAYEERVPSGDWTFTLPDGERQSSRNSDSMACVTYSALNCVEMQMKLYGVTMNLSDRWLAKMSDTLIIGNYLWKVGDTLRKYGSVPEDYWPVPANFTWDEYYANIPLPIRNEGLEVLKLWDIRYEWLPDTQLATLQYHLKHSPIQVVIPGHAVALITTNGQLMRYFDSYAPFQKDYASPFQAAMKYVVTPKTKNMTQEDVRNLYRLAFYREPDAVELGFWTGKALSEFLATAIKDRAAFLALP
jgi:hypothetical protein